MSLVNWNWQGENVQTEVTQGEYVSAESTLLLAGPSRLSMLSVDSDVLDTTNSLLPIGLIQNMNVSQQRQLNKIFEVGSKRSYFVPGRLFGNFQVGRIMFYGPSLLRMMYALAPFGDDALGNFGNDLNTDPDSSGNLLSSLPAYDGLFPNQELQNAPGFGGTADETTNRDLFLNLNSELFNVPFGLCMVMKDTRDRPYGAFYMEDCMLEMHNFQVDSGSVVIAENVSGQFDAISPIQLSSVAFS